MRQRVLIAIAIALRPGADHRRRADQRARRHRAAAHPRSDRRAAPRIRHRGSAGDARPRRRRRPRRPAGRAAGRAHPGAGTVKRRPGRAAQRLYAPASVRRALACQAAPAARRSRRASKRLRDRRRGPDAGLSRSAAAAEAFRAVDDISFKVPRGTTHALVGESGSGKTTTVRTVVGFLKPTAGRILVDGVDLTTLKGEALRQFRRKIQLVYQNPFGSLDPRQTIFRIVEEPLLNFEPLAAADRAAKVRDIIDRVGLPQSVLDRHPRALSGGQRQRVAIARALVLDPQVLVLDEAVSALDVTVQAQILELLDELQQALGLTYLFVSHDLAVVRQISDTVSVLHKGRQVDSGASNGLRATRQRLYARADRRHSGPQYAALASHPRAHCKVGAMTDSTVAQTARLFHPPARRGDAAERYRLATEQIVACRALRLRFRLGRPASFPRGRGRLAVALRLPGAGRRADLAHPAGHRHRHPAARAAGSGRRGCRRARSPLRRAPRGRRWAGRHAHGLRGLRPRQHRARTR